MKKRLHILFLSGWYPSRVTPENGDFIQRHAEAVALIHEVTVIHVITDPSVQGIEISDKTSDSVRTLIAYIQHTKNPFTKAFRFISAYTRLLKKAKKLDFIHLSKLYPAGIVALYLKLFKRKKYIISEHHHIYHYPYNQKIGFWQKLLSKIITKQATFVSPVSDDLGFAMQDFGLKGNYRKVPNVVKTDIFHAREKKHSNTFMLLHVSNMAAVKNVEKILEVIAELQNHIADFVFYLIGSDSAKYESYALSLKIKPDKIKFIDQIDQEELSEYYRKSDVFLLFSSIENLPCVILESFSCGTQVISTNVGGISEFFPEKYGYLIESGNKKQLLNHIIKIQTNHERASSSDMHAYVEKNFSPRSIAAMFDTLYKTSSKD